ncbi:hypothetical protein SAMN05216603_11241 [Pseudomonas benzenivorans]|nr:hypothetical protein SAMN05216603_11241 [Pseudomonas benzenivorans]
MNSLLQGGGSGGGTRCGCKGFRRSEGDAASSSAKSSLSTMPILQKEQRIALVGGAGRRSALAATAVQGLEGPIADKSAPTGGLVRRGHSVRMQGLAVSRCIRGDTFIPPDYFKVNNDCSNPDELLRQRGITTAVVCSLYRPGIRKSPVVYRSGYRPGSPALGLTGSRPDVSAGLAESARDCPAASATLSCTLVTSVASGHDLLRSAWRMGRSRILRLCGARVVSAAGQLPPSAAQGRGGDLD